MTAPLPPPPSAAERDSIVSAHDKVIGILEFAGLHLCAENKDPCRAIWCGCAPGRCQQAEADNA